MARSGFKMRSGNATAFRQMGNTPVKQTLFPNSEATQRVRENRIEKSINRRAQNDAEKEGAVYGGMQPTVEVSGVPQKESPTKIVKKGIKKIVKKKAKKNAKEKAKKTVVKNTAKPKINKHKVNKDGQLNKSTKAYKAMQAEQLANTTKQGKTLLEATKNFRSKAWKVAKASMIGSYVWDKGADMFDTYSKTGSIGKSISQNIPLIGGLFDTDNTTEQINYEKATNTTDSIPNYYKK